MYNLIIDLAPLEPQPKGLMFLGWRGSIAHGTYQPPAEPTAIDDVDVIGVVIPDATNYLGLHEWGSRGTKEVKKEHCDAVYYELRKFVQLLLQGNPNVLSTLWLPDNLIIRSSSEWESLLDIRSAFVGKHVFNAFFGYAQAQLKKMFATEGMFAGYMGDKRKQLVKQFGYDTKNASHLIRLLRQGIEFIETGNLVVVRPDAQELLAIKRGELPLAQVRELSESLFEKFKEAEKTSTLPEEPDCEKVEEWLVDTLSNNIAMEYYGYDPWDIPY
jgi:predicted nucleotidyltransferase